MNEYANDERPGLPKGPWFVGSLPPPTWRYICGADGNVIASVAEWDSTGNLMQEFGGAVQAKAVAEAIAAIPNTQAEIDRLRTENEALKSAEANKDWLALVAKNKRLLNALKEIKQLNEMSGFNGCAIAEVYSKHLPNPPRRWKDETK